MMPIVPCKGCDKRHPACHDSCDMYKKFKEELQLIHDARDKYYENKQVVDYMLTNKRFAKKIRYKQP